MSEGAASSRNSLTRSSITSASGDDSVIPDDAESVVEGDASDMLNVCVGWCLVVVCAHGLTHLLCVPRLCSYQFFFVCEVINRRYRKYTHHDLVKPLPRRILEHVVTKALLMVMPITSTIVMAFYPDAREVRLCEIGRASCRERV